MSTQRPSFETRAVYIGAYAMSLLGRDHELLGGRTALAKEHQIRLDERYGGEWGARLAAAKDWEDMWR